MRRRKNEIRYIRRSEYIRIYESIVIECFLRLEIYKIGTCVSRFAIEKCNFVDTMVNHETLYMQFYG